MRSPVLFLCLSLKSCVLAQGGESTLYIHQVLAKDGILPRELKDSLQGKDFSTL